MTVHTPHDLNAHLAGGFTINPGQEQAFSEIMSTATVDERLMITNNLSR